MCQGLLIAEYKSC